MIYRNLGNTGLKVSEIALGCEGFAELSAKESRKRMEQAMSYGVNFFDMYASSPKLRDNMGYAIKGHRDDLIIQGHLCSTWKNEQYLRTRNIEEVRESFEDLMKRLDTDYIDIGMIHYIDAEEDFHQVFDGPVMEYALELKKQGRIKHIGMSSHNPAVAKMAVETGLIEVLMFSINPSYDMQPPTEDVEQLWADEVYMESYHNQDASRTELYELCEKMGVGIDVMKAFGGGDLLDEELSPFGKTFTVNQCIHYALTRPAVGAIMGGFRSEENLKEMVAYEMATEEEKDYANVLSGLERHSFEGHCMYCGHCAPCPKGIDVASVTKYLNLAVAQGEVPETVREHYKLLNHHADECIACGSCEKNCPFGVKIIDNMKRAAKLFG
ncbi:MAG: aldo/keto reductase [Anaerostipes sp.]|jgi:predicted aldo/keto reductase-like oxidoreductase|nr:aldo/keto reductase [Anaerostipes sp.]